MARHRSHSVAFKRQVAGEFIAGETLHALSKRHDISRQLIRIWVSKFEAGALDDDVQAADLIQEYEAKIAALERMVGRQALELELLKRLSCRSSVVSTFYGLTRAAAPPGCRYATPPLAASALTRCGPCQSWLWSARTLCSNALPWRLGPDDCVEDAKEASHACDKRDLFGSPALDQGLVVLADDGIPPGGRQGCHVEGVSDFGATTSDQSSASHLTGVAIDWGDADESCDAPSIELAQFGQISDQRSRRDLPDAWDRRQQFVGFSPSR